MQGYSMVIYVLQQLGVLTYIQLILLGVLVVAVVLYFLKRA